MIGQLDLNSPSNFSSPTNATLLRAIYSDDYHCYITPHHTTIISISNEVDSLSTIKLLNCFLWSLSIKRFIQHWNVDSCQSFREWNSLIFSLSYSFFSVNFFRWIALAKSYHIIFSYRISITLSIQAFKKAFVIRIYYRHRNLY